MNYINALALENKEVLPGVFRLTLEAPQIAADARPGQFIMVNCGEELQLPRPISIHKSADGAVTLLFRMIGDGTHFLARLAMGDKVSIFGPLGNGFTTAESSKRLLLIAGGMGIAPIYFLAEKAVQQRKDVTVLYGSASADRISLPDGVEVIAATDDGSVGYHGQVTKLLSPYAGSADQILACGPMRMYKAMQESVELKNKPTQISLEVRMACGRGVCYGCTILTKNGLKKACESGPVFEMNDIDWGWALL